MRNRKIGASLCGVFNIVAGAAGALAGGVLTLMGIGFGGGPLDVLPAVALFLAGVLYVVSGPCFLLRNKRAWAKGLALQGVAILLGAAWVIFVLAASVGVHAGFDPHDEEVMMFTLLPAAGLLLAIAEYGWLWRNRPSV